MKNIKIFTHLKLQINKKYQTNRHVSITKVIIEYVTTWFLEAPKSETGTNTK